MSALQIMEHVRAGRYLEVRGSFMPDDSLMDPGTHDENCSSLCGKQESGMTWRDNCVLPCLLLQTITLIDPAGWVLSVMIP